MALSPSGRIRVNVTGARGGLGIELTGTITPGQFLVSAPGGGRRFTTASGTGADAGLRTDLAASNGFELVGGLNSVKTAAELAAYIANARPVLRRAFERQRHPLAIQFRPVAEMVVTAAGANTTDGQNVRVWTPGGQYSSVGCWVRDMSMAIAAAPEFFPSEQILSAYQWYKQKVKLTTYEVPDHITLAGQPFYKPGGNDADPFGGVRATADGGPFLLQMAWMHYVLTGSNDTYNSEKQFLLNLLEVGLPYSSAGAVYVDPNNRFFQWGFQDSVIATGNVLFCSVLAFQAYRQLADMAYAAGDYATARLCVNRAEKVRSGVNSTLWAQDSIGAVGKGGYYLCADFYSKQPDIWGSALACYTDLAPKEYQRGISVNMSFAWNAMTGGKPELYYRGGVRHGLRSRDFQTNAQVFEGSVVVPGVSDFDTYQNGGYWNTPLAWVTYAIGITAPDIAAKLAVQSLCECSYEGWAYLPRTDGGAPNPQPAEWVSILTSDIGGGRLRPRLGAVNYLTSVTALMSISAADCGPFNGPQSVMSPSTTVDDATIPAATWARLKLDQSTIDEMLAIDTENGVIHFPFTGQYEITGKIRFQPTSAPTEVLVALNVQNQRNRNLGDSAVPNGLPFTVGGSESVGALKGTVAALDMYGSGPITPQYLAPTPGEPNPYHYTRFSVTYLGPIL